VSEKNKPFIISSMDAPDPDGVRSLVSIGFHSKKHRNLKLSKSLKFAHLLFVLFLMLFLSTSCGKELELHQALEPQVDREEEANELLQSDPKGPIPKPNIPSALSSLGLDTQSERMPTRERIEYLLEVNSPDLPEADTLFKATAELSTLKDKPIYSPFLLMARLRSGIKTGEDILNSLGYYDGKCEGTIEKIKDPPGTKVVVNFTPGVRYLVGETKILVESSNPEIDSHPEKYPNFTLKDTGLNPGDPAIAANILQAVNKMPELWGDVGYPSALLAGTRYILDSGKKTLDIEATIDPGEFTRMGKLIIEGDNPVRPGFIENSINWKIGQAWNEDLVDKFQDNLFQKGIFKPLNVERSQNLNPDGTRDLILHVERAPLRTVSGSINYDSDFGPGVDIAWEHRNLTRWGDKFRIEIPVWQDLQQLGLQYTRPYFFSKRQNFLANSSFLRETTTAYKLMSMSVAAGIERQLSRHLLGTLLITLERGTLDEYMDRKEEYMIVGFPLTFNWNWVNDLLDPTKGHNLKINVTPYNGHYYSNFSVVKTRIDAYEYIPLKEDGFLVAAFRLSMGAIFGDNARVLPTTMRFFSGGGGSIRGYRYQSIGPRTYKDKPAGGGFITEASGELRWRFTEHMGVTLFVDGGMLYEDFDINYLGKDILWGGGLGFRYYTPVGPFRIDIASPLTPREHDPRFQFYISLGQSF
jgi:translocation and assembly module TamA